MATETYTVVDEQIWDDTPLWDKEPEVAEKYIQELDQAVEDVLPDGATFEDMIPYGMSFWTRTAQIVARKDGDEVSFFLKVSIGDIGKGMMSGEYLSMKTLNSIAPQLAPEPLAWGTYQSDPNIHFFLCSFHEMDEPPCSLETLPKLVAEMHLKGVSPSGKFGFPMTTYQGRLAQDATECDTWEECFSRNLKRMFEHELEAQGYEEEFVRLSDTVMAKVIPRLLRPLETGGRTVVPRLVHGDMWDGNTGTDLETGEPKIFDACSLYAHNEYELAPWRPVRHKMGRPYIKAYLQHFPASEPVEDFDGRNLLYNLKFNMCSSALYPGNLKFRNLALVEMRELVERYGEGYEEWAKTHT